MPAYLCHLAFAEKVYRKLSSCMPLDKIKFMSGNIIPDLAAVDKGLSHYRKDASIKGIFEPDMEQVAKDLLVLEDPIKLGMYCHLYLDNHFIEGFLIPELILDRTRMKIVNPRNKMEWDPEPFFRKNGVYYGALDEIDYLLIKDQKFSMQIISELPDILDNTGIEMFDKRQEKTWKAELNEYISRNKEYSGNVFDYERLLEFIDKTSIQLTNEIIGEMA